jgi:hypothetical protein
MRKISILLLFIGITLGSYAQDTLHFVTNNFSLNIDTTANTAITIQNGLYFTGRDSAFSSIITFKARVDTTIIDTPRFLSPIYDTTNIFSRGVSKVLTFTIKNDTSPPFTIGNNTIVVWPVYHMGNNLGYIGPNDSIHISANYIPLGIADAPLAKMYIYQIPGHLNIVFGDAQNIVQQVRIVNVLGQSIYTGAPDRSKNILTAGWNQGIYLCEVSTYQGEKRTFKFRIE